MDPPKPVAGVCSLKPGTERLGMQQTQRPGCSHSIDGRTSRLAWIGRGDVARIYIDGVDRTVDDAVRNDFKTNDQIHLGQMSNASNRLGGGLDDVRVFARWLEDQEIADLAVGKLLAYWKGDDSDRDDSGFDRVLTRIGSSFSTQSVRGTHSINYDGVDDYAFASATNLGDKFTISIWSWMPAGLPAASKTLFSNSPGGSASNGFRWFVNSWATNNGALLFETANGTIGDSGTSRSRDLCCPPSGTISRRSWTAQPDVVELYFNRRKVTGDNTIRTDFANDLGLFAGSFTGGGAPWQGQLDDIRSVCGNGERCGHFSVGIRESQYRTADLRARKFIERIDDWRERDLHGDSDGCQCRRTLALLF